MSYYHVRLYYYAQREPPKIQHRDLLNIVITQLEKEVIEPYLSGKRFELCDRLFDPSEIAEFLIRATPRKVPVSVIYGEEFVSGADVTNQFLKKSYPKKTSEKETTKETKSTSKDVFIVHGRDHAPMKELKTMLLEFGLNPIVLHEQPSGSRTIVEKLEKYSNVGFAFVILAPDDPYLSAAVKVSALPSKKREDVAVIIPTLNEEINWADPDKDGSWKLRARQNVVLEFGYFMGLLGRDRVCCLHKGNVELPSDMQGIVYIPFKNSINEVEEMISKELAEAGYNVSSRKEEAKDDPKPATDISIVKTPSLFDHDKLIEVYSPIHAMIVRVNREIPRGFGLIGSWVKTSLIDSNSISALFNQHNDKLRNRDLEMWLEIEKEIKARNGFYLNEDRQAWFDELEVEYNRLTKHQKVK